MNMNEQDVRALVREAIERHLGRPDSATNRLRQGSGESRRSAFGAEAEVAPYRIDSTPEAHVDRESPDSRRARLQSSYGHPSHILLTVLPGSEVDDGTCVIEPRVRCNHCGFCQSYGH
jgi:hypothetical protein